MKSLTGFILAFIIIGGINAQSGSDKEGIEKACMGYIEGFYEGDSLKIIENVRPTLTKFGYWKNEASGEYKGAGYMTFDQAVDYVNSVRTKKNFAKPDAPKKVEVLDILNHIAVAKVTAWWGKDYVLLSKTGDKWMIDQVLWEGPLGK